MNRSAILGDRHVEVRRAAAAWKASGEIGEEALATIDELYKDDRIRLGPVFRTLAFFFTALGIMGSLGLFFIASNEKVLLIFFGLVLWAGTEVLIGPAKFSLTGAETATGILAVLFLSVGVGVYLSPTLPECVAFALVLVAIAAYRWGGMLWGGSGAVLVFYLLAQLPHPRALFVLVALLAAYPLLRLGDAKSLPPSQRRGSLAAFCVCLAALYFALDLASWDKGALEALAEHARQSVPEDAFRPLAIWGTALLPVALVALGIARRRALILDAGLLLAFLSFGTLRLYVHIAPLSVCLLGAGGVLVLLALGVRKLLDSGAHRERGGFTAEPLFSSSRGFAALEVASLVGTAGPAPAPQAPGGYEGGGGRSGGGGATDSY